MKIRIEPYRAWSGGARALGERAGILRATRRQVEKHGDFDYIINWGRSERRFSGEYINAPEAVARASNKLEASRLFSDAGVPQPDCTDSVSTVREWLDGGSAVVARTLLRANSGRGIVYLDQGFDGEIPRAPMYTKYIPKTSEFRVHVFGDQIIDVQEKRRKLETPDEEVNWQIRNACNGFIFARSDVALPECVGRASVDSVRALGLDFGAVDVGYNARREKCRVYEVNTAPGLEGSTLDSYYDAVLGRFPVLKGGMYRKRRESGTNIVRVA